MCIRDRCWLMMTIPTISLSLTHTHTHTATSPHNFRLGTIWSSTHSPDLMSTEHHLSKDLKSFLGGQQFHNDNNNVKQAVNMWFKSQPGNFYDEGIQCLRLKSTLTLTVTIQKCSLRCLLQILIKMLYKYILYFLKTHWNLFPDIPGI